MKNKVDVREKALVIKGFKPVGANVQIIPDPSNKGGYINEWQPVKYVTFVAFEKFFAGFKDMGYKIFEIESYGDFEDLKDEIDKIVFPISQVDSKDAKEKATQELLIAMQKKIEELEANQKEPKTKKDAVSTDVIEAVRIEYKNVIGEDVPKNMKNKVEWMQERINENKN